MATSEHVQDTDDLLWEILLRLPPQPSSLHRASAVCKRWQCITANPRFLREFRAHHHVPPLLGGFEQQEDGRVVFTSFLDPPDQIPADRLSHPMEGPFSGWILLDCRHGRLLAINTTWCEILVCDPITGHRCRIDVPSGFAGEPPYPGEPHGAVLCAATDEGHCHSSPFKVVMVRTLYSHGYNNPIIAFVYSSELNMWGGRISTVHPSATHLAELAELIPSTLISNALYWWIDRDILEFDVVKESLNVINAPLMQHKVYVDTIQIIHAEDGGVAIAVLRYPCLQIWESKFKDCHGRVATWLLHKSIKLDMILNLRPVGTKINRPSIVGYAHDTIFIFNGGKEVHMLQLGSMKVKQILCERPFPFRFHLFTSFFIGDICNSVS